MVRGTPEASLQPVVNSDGTGARRGAPFKQGGMAPLPSAHIENLKEESSRSKIQDVSSQQMCILSLCRTLFVRYLVACVYRNNMQIVGLLVPGYLQATIKSHSHQLASIAVVSNSPAACQRTIPETLPPPPRSPISQTWLPLPYEKGR